MKREIITVNNFYENPEAVVRYAMGLRYYNPYANNWKGSSSPDAMAHTGWRASLFKRAADCPFKSSAALIEKLEAITGEEIDLEHWNRDYPEHPETGALIEPWPHLIDPRKPETVDNMDLDATSCRWNCAFQVKHAKQSTLGEGAHNHNRDFWNGVGPDGWTGLIYLNKVAPREAGLKILNNKYRDNDERFTSPDRWELIDDFGNVYNRLILVRGWMPHVGGNGFGDSLETGRLFQTLFFKTKNPQKLESFRAPL